jgi:cyclopropane-fatty-acyl-phospholipid synthase
MKPLLEWAERGWIPDPLIRRGIRRLDRRRLDKLHGDDAGRRRENERRLVEAMNRSPLALVPAKPNEQHYELPAEFFRNVLGKRMKYSCCLWPAGTATLDAAEEAMLDLTCRRAELEDGMDVLELGCGWGSLTLWIAERYPNCRVLAVSNSRGQREYIHKEASRRGIGNVTAVTADMNEFRPDKGFDRVVSVEMFEHMRNWRELLARIAGWLNPRGKVFVHVFSHREFAYTFSDDGKDWIGTHFFSGGLMPSDDLLTRFRENLRLEDRWRVSGVEYRRTADAWLQNLDARRDTVLPTLIRTYGPDEARRWLQRWRMFFMAVSELWGFHGGGEWMVSHYRLAAG